MASKKATSKKKSATTRAVKQSGSSAKRACGKPFEKGHKYAWKPGQSGNPKGRPKKRTLSEDLRARLEEMYPRRADVTYQRMVAEALVDRAINGDITATSGAFLKFSTLLF